MRMAYTIEFETETQDSWVENASVEDFEATLNTVMDTLRGAVEGAIDASGYSDYPQELPEGKRSVTVKVSVGAPFAGDYALAP